jgi:N-acetylglutamate synthase-like GNAT family acetyltransferase
LTGFRRIEADGVPRKVQETLEWCEREIDRPVILMKLVKS